MGFAVFVANIVIRCLNYGILKIDLKGSGDVFFLSENVFFCLFFSNLGDLNQILTISEIPHGI